MGKKIRILVTGGTGFVGRNLVKRLRRRYEIRVLSRKEGDTKGDLLSYIDSKNATKKIDIVIHLAFSKNYPENIIMIKNLLMACKENKVKRIILISSMSAKRSFPDDYGKNKLTIEKIVKESGLDYTILRPSIIYGKGSKSFDFIIEKIKKIPFFVPVIGSGLYKISPVHVGDIIKIIEKCIWNRKTKNKEYDLPGGSDIYFIDLINELKKELNIKKRNIHIPILVCNFLATIFPGTINKENIKNMTEGTLANIKNAREDLDYKPKKFKEGVKNGLL